jgi:hypothetical protein
MIDDHVYRPDYAGLDPEKQFCTLPMSDGAACGAPRRDHALFVSLTTSLTEQLGLTNASTEVSPELPVPQTSSDEATQHPDRDGGGADGRGPGSIDDTEGDSGSAAVAAEVARKLANRPIRLGGSDPLQLSEVDLVNHPPHYTGHPSGVEAIDIGRHLTADWFNAFKYIFRCDLKNGRQDVEKALWYAKDATSHGIRMHAPTWGETQIVLIQKIIAKEPDPLKRAFFASVRDGFTDYALDWIERILAAS